MVAGEGDDQLWGSGCSAIAGCHCSVPRCGKGEGRPSLGEWCHCCHCCVLWLGGRKTTNFGGVVPLLGAGGVDVVPLLGIQTNCLEFLADVTLFSTLITQKLVFAIWGYLGSMLV